MSDYCIAPRHVPSGRFELPSQPSEGCILSIELRGPTIVLRQTAQRIFVFRYNFSLYEIHAIALVRESQMLLFRQGAMAFLISLRKRDRHYGASFSRQYYPSAQRITYRPYRSVANTRKTYSSFGLRPRGPYGPAGGLYCIHSTTRAEELLQPNL